MDEGEALVAAAVAGLGLAQVPGYMADDALRAGALVEVLAPFRPPPLPISIVYASGRQLTPRLRALLDLLTAA
jgi:DNA-binding transcriptional LysR family regulator